VHCNARIDEARETVTGLAGAGHVLVRGDLRSPEECQRVVAQAESSLGGLDVVVNNAALATASELAHPVDSTDFDEWVSAWRTFTEINLWAPAHISWAAAHSMIASGVSGRIINIGSRAAFRGEIHHPAYAATKAGLHALGQSLALSLGPHGIAVASVAPGFIATERIAERFGETLPASITADSPLGRVGTSEEVAAAVYYLASAEAQWASGAILDLNGASHFR
jgi:NAD(P)-dependent dehydrogenase (short-subunit alcohol dehydrogenase family)